MMECSVSSGGKDAEQITTREKETSKPGDGGRYWQESEGPYNYGTVEPPPSLTLLLHQGCSDKQNHGLALEKTK